eukprot:4391667-Prymnesium_polylepis.1
MSQEIKSINFPCEENYTIRLCVRRRRRRTEPCLEPMRPVRAVLRSPAASPPDALCACRTRRKS